MLNSSVMVAYVIENGQNIDYGKQNDGEWGGSFKILEVPKENQCTNAAVFVIRQHGGASIGPS